jgi:putative transposase
MPHHITQRGNNRQDVFFVDEDRHLYLRFLVEQAGKYHLDVHGYCLMTNHVHLIVTPKDEDSLAKAVGRTHFLYTQYVNRMHGRSGHLWQNRFYSCPLDNRHFFQALRYVECNPVRARMHRLAWAYPFSSGAFHIGRDQDNPLLNERWWQKASSGLNWQEILREAQGENEIENIRCQTRRGRPLGTDRFISKVENLLGRRVRALPVGRPKKTNK